MLEFANDKKITESMNEMEIYEYLECMLKIIKNNKMHKKISVLCFIGCGRSTVQQRFDLIIKGQEKKYKHRGYILYIMVFCFSYILSFVFAFEPDYNNPSHKSDEIIYNLENKDTFFIKNNKGYKINYKGRFIGNCKSLETFQGYRVYKNDKEAKENEEIK